MKEALTNKELDQKPGYKKNKLGWIPKDWEIKKLKAIGSFKNGMNKSKEDYGNGRPFVNLMDVFGRKAVNLNGLGLVETTENDLLKYGLKKGDVLFIRSSVKPSGVGLAALVDKNPGKVTYSGFLIRFREKGYLYDEYKKYCFDEPKFRHRLKCKSTISANTNINQQSLGNLRLLLPPLPEQKKIAEILSTWDRAIETLEQLIAKKEELKRGLMQKLLTGKTRFPGFEGVWEEIKLNKLITTFSGGTPSRSKPEYYNGTIPWIKSGELNTRRIFNTKEFITEEGLKNSSAKLVKKNTLLLAIYGATAGVISVNMMEKASINQAVLALVPKNNKIDQGFLELWFSFNKDKIVHTYTQGGQPNLSAKIVKSLTIECPDVEEQRKISKLIFSISNEIEIMKKAINAFKNQKKGLMQQLLTGKTRIKV
ncbi:MAG: restriction endonuclease subunit S [Balneolaceae bacterium]|nr:restriction endonuclease subunit S [Balneolaceae bacterium]